MLRVALAAFVVAYVPGALAFRLPWGQRERAAFPAEERAFWAVLLSLSWSVAVVIGLALLGRYSFERLIGVNLAVAAVMLFLARGRLRFQGGAPWPSASAFVPVALVALGGWLYLPPSEYVIGGKDPGTYLNEGVQIAQRGAITVVADPAIAAVPAQLRDLFFPADTAHLAHYYGLRFMGFWITDPSQGRVIGQFPHLLPASVAIGYGLNGLSGARQAVGVWAILGLLAVYFAGARLFGAVAGAAAAGLLAINVLQIWFARDPSAEMVSQPLIFAAVLAFSYAMNGSRGFFGAVAGALVGLMMFLRYDNILTIAAFCAAAVLLPAARARIGVAFGLTLVATSALGFWDLHGPLSGYAEFPSRMITDRGGWWTIVAAAIAAIVAWGVLHRESAAGIVRRWLPGTIAAALAGLAIYAYFFRREAWPLALHDAMAFRAFGWYLTPIVLALAVTGVAVATSRHFWRNPAFFLTVAAYAVVFFYKARIAPVHFWSMRRFLAVALPAALLGVAALAAEFGGAIAPRRWRTAVVTACVIAVCAPIAWVFWSRSAPVRHHVEYAGVIPKLEALAARIGDRDLLIVESRNAGSDLHTLAVPLAYIYARNVLVLASAAPPKRSFETFVMWARTRYDNVLFLGGGGSDLLTRRVAAEPLASEQFQVPEYHAPENAYPAGPRRKDLEFSLYRLTTTPEAAAGPITVTIGERDDLHVVRFYGKERRGDTGTPFRWSRSQSFVVLAGIGADARQVTVWMSASGRPATAPAPIVEVALSDRVIGTATPGDEVRPYVFALPADLASAAAAQVEPVRLRLRVPTWNPKTLVGGNDGRDLGVLVTRVEVR